MIKRLKEFYFNSSIRVKINLLIVGAAGIILILLLTIVSVRSRSIVLDFAEKSVDSQGKENTYKAVEFVNKKQSALRTLVNSFESQAERLGSKFDIYKSSMKYVADKDKDLYAVWFIEDFNSTDSTKAQRFFYSSEHNAQIGKIEPLVESQFGMNRVKSNGDVFISNPLDIDGAWVFDIAVPIKINGKIVGAAGFVIKTDYLINLVTNAMPADEGICKILTGDGKIAAHPSKSSWGLLTNEGESTDQVLEHIKKNEYYSDYAHSNTYGFAYKAFVPIPFEGTSYSWSYCTVVPLNKMLHETTLLAWITVILIIAGLVTLVMVTNFLSKMLTRPITYAAEQLRLISEGRLNQTNELNIHGNDEIGKMVKALNLLTASQKHLAYFANEVGKGNLTLSIEVKNDQDIIGRSMVEMKQNLIDAREAEEKRKVEENIRSWKVMGNTRIHEIIRKENSSIKHLCTSVIHEIISYSEAIQGGVFVIDDSDTSDRYVELMACIAYSRTKMMQKRMPIEEGLIGRCIFEKAPILLKELPQDYLEITSGLGERNPNFLAIIPLINNEEIVGAMEIASFNELGSYVVEYLEKSAESLASAISNVKINERTQRLLEQSKQYAEEVGAQEEELRQNMEEMQASQEEMFRKSKDYEDKIAQLNEELEQRNLGRALE